MDRRLLWVLPVAAVLVWAVWSNQGVHEVSLDKSLAAVGQSFDPYAFWYHQSDAGWVHHYPKTVGPNCLGRVLANEEGALSTTQIQAASVEGGVAGYGRSS